LLNGELVQTLSGRGQKGKSYSGREPADMGPSPSRVNELKREELSNKIRQIFQTIE